MRKFSILWPQMRVWKKCKMVRYRLLAALLILPRLPIQTPLAPQIYWRFGKTQLSTRLKTRFIMRARLEIPPAPRYHAGDAKKP